MLSDCCFCTNNGVDDVSVDLCHINCYCLKFNYFIYTLHFNNIMKGAQLNLILESIIICAFFTASGNTYCCSSEAEEEGINLLHP